MSEPGERLYQSGRVVDPTVQCVLDKAYLSHVHRGQTALLAVAVDESVHQVALVDPPCNLADRTVQCVVAGGVFLVASSVGLGTFQVLAQPLLGLAQSRITGSGAVGHEAGIGRPGGPTQRS